MIALDALFQPDYVLLCYTRLTSPSRLREMYQYSSSFQGSDTSPYHSSTTTTEAYAHELYSAASEDGEVNGFLEETHLYNTSESQWSILSACEKVDHLVNSVYNIVSTIVHRFSNATDAGVEREVVDTRNFPNGDNTNEDGYRCCPIIAVYAAGPSFQSPRTPSVVSTATRQPLLGFSNMATYLSIKLEAEAGTEEENVDEMASYARQVFRDQPNRIFVRCLILTERHARLVHFDRAGSQITPPIDIHRHPRTLVRLVAGLSSPNERLLGLDDSIQWTIVDGVKAGGTLTTIDAMGKMKVFPIIEEMPVPREAISGRATTCWKVQDPESGQEYVVKDSWRPDDQSPEHELLELVRGIPGVVDIVSFEVGRGETRDFRCPNTYGNFHNRYASRILMKSYGKPVQYFTSILQLLCAIRDVIAGHQRLLGDGVKILHRDISPNNVLLGEVGAPEGRRGVLIDLDMAFRATDEKPRVRTDINIGTRLFQSLSLLETFPLEDFMAPHDYLDDLESFFYLLAYIFFLLKPDGTRWSNTDEGPSIIRQWGHKDTGAAMIAKGSLLGLGRSVDRAVKLVEDNWGSVCSELFDKYRNYVSEIHDEKIDLLGASGGDPNINPYESLHGQCDEHYAAILSMFDEAITATQTSLPAPGSLPNDVTATQTTSHPCFRNQNGRLSVPPSGSDRTPAVPLPLSAIVAMPSTTSIPPPIATQPRRSARLQNLRLTKTERVSPPTTAAQAVPSSATELPATHQPTTQLRRSVCILKRRMEDDEHGEPPPPKARRNKRGLRDTTGTR